MINLHFFNPFLKMNSQTYTYDILMGLFNKNGPKVNNEFLKKVKEYIAELKIELFEKMEE